jgi:hypothetical protein
MHHYLLYHKPEDDWYLNLVLGQAQRCDRVAPGTLKSRKIGKPKWILSFGEKVIQRPLTGYPQSATVTYVWERSTLVHQTKSEIKKYWNFTYIFRWFG